jgi:hypothetical protein
MSKSQVEHDIRRLLNHEVDDAQRAVRNGDLAKAKRELDDVEDKLKRILRDVAQIQER